MWARKPTTAKFIRSVMHSPKKTYHSHLYRSWLTIRIATICRRFWSYRLLTRIMKTKMWLKDLWLHRLLNHRKRRFRRLRKIKSWKSRLLSERTIPLLVTHTNRSNYMAREIWLHTHHSHTSSSRHQARSGHFVHRNWISNNWSISIRWRT